ncbi:MAG: septal ring lytic transglycosylase RlpA family protein [Candidatus Latescibacteria bacterium]|nr:septal ring lytic transglycosylase RlpA family protein [Candidatus Latescibacterota bacterium]MBT4139515.1 septal ring lytic transglycosylase RlpA family protein [Candidatus Latescibacterota bacterium]MBT5828828.1 septal ring lytic transglycosylase RlpA family protein [Candidatus Latescibacterota bacterium]
MGWRIFQNSSAASNPPNLINHSVRHILLLCALLALSGCVSHPRYRTKPVTQKPAEKPKSTKPNQTDTKPSKQKEDASITVSNLPIDPKRIKSEPYQIGNSSYYAHKFHGRLTANGEIYDMNGLSAAHRELPLGTMIRVTHLGNGKSVTLKVNDRGPFIEGRILDLSLGAARKLEMIEAGVAKVMIEIVKPVD